MSKNLNYHPQKGLQINTYRNVNASISLTAESFLDDIRKGDHASISLADTSIKELMDALCDGNSLATKKNWSEDQLESAYNMLANLHSDLLIENG